jgi:hypothetical protein
LHIQKQEGKASDGVTLPKRFNLPSVRQMEYKGRQGLTTIILGFIENL